MNGPYIFLAYVSLFIMGIIDNSRGPIYPELLETFQITAAQGSWVFTLASLVSIFVALTVSWWMPRFKDIGASKVALFLAAICTLIMAYAGKDPNGLYLFLVAIFLLGICLGIISITINLIVVRNTQMKHQRKVLAGLHSMYGLASLLSPLIISSLYNLNLSWSYYFLSLSVLAIIVLVVTRKTKSAQVPIVNSTHRAPLNLMVIVGLMIGSYIASEVLISSRIVYFLVEKHQMSKAHAGHYLTVFFALLLTGRILSSFINEKISSFFIMTTSLLLSLLTASLGLWFEAKFLVFTGLTMSPFYPAGINWISQKFPRYSEEIMSKFMIAVGLMLSILHFVFGVVATEFGVLAAMFLVNIFTVIALVCLFYSHFHSDIVKADPAR